MEASAAGDGEVDMAMNDRMDERDLLMKRTEMRYRSDERVEVNVVPGGNKRRW
jgi:hypothetical protein